MQKKIIIFDRDNTLNIDEFGYVHNKTKCELFEDVYDFFSLIDTFINVCVVTNQSGIGRGYFTVQDMENFNEEINRLIRFKTNHRGIDRFFFCPHVPSDMCNCRKPNNGLINEALKYFKCKPSEALLIGDKVSDCEAGLSAGVLSLLIDRNFQSLNNAKKSKFITLNSLKIENLKKYLS